MTAASVPVDVTSTRDVILDAAEARFAERGFDGVSVREIAADAGLRNQASLYHYFENKQAIYEAVLQRGIEAIVSIFADGGGPVPGRLADDLDRVVDELVEHPHLARLIQRAGLDDDAFVRNAVPRLVAPLYARGIEFLQANDGRWSIDELPHLAAGLYHLIFGYFANAALLQSVVGEDPRSPAAIARQRRFLKTAVAQLLGEPTSIASPGRER